MKSVFINVVLTTALVGLLPQLASAAERAADNDPCVIAAIAQTETEFPLNQPVVGANFFEWGSSTDSGWEVFPSVTNLGLSPGSAYYASQDEIVKSIDLNYGPTAAKDPSESPTQAQDILKRIQGRKILSVDFNFSEATYGRYFIINSESGGKCSVEHLDLKLDDFDNG